LDLAREIAPTYASHPDIMALFVHGSAARGWADRYSDIELAVIWRHPPTEQDLRQIAAGVGGDSWKLAPFDELVQVWPEVYHVRGVKLDLGHWTYDAMQSIIADVVERYETNEHKQLTVSVCQHAHILVGDDVVGQWKAQAAKYPDDLARAMIRENLSFMSSASRAMLAERNEIPLLYENHCQTVRRIIRVLLGLNRIYYPGFKWTRHVVAQMALSPPNLFPRMERLFQSDAMSSTNEMLRLVAETFDLVEKYQPDIDLTSCRERFNEPYPYWEQQP
jgi:hypothetical protein